MHQPFWSFLNKKSRHIDPLVHIKIAHYFVSRYKTFFDIMIHQDNKLFLKQIDTIFCCIALYKLIRLISIQYDYVVIGM